MYTKTKVVVLEIQKLSIIIIHLVLINVIKKPITITEIKTSLIKVLTNYILDLTTTFPIISIETTIVFNFIKLILINKIDNNKTGKKNIGNFIEHVGIDDIGLE